MKTLTILASGRMHKDLTVTLHGNLMTCLYGNQRPFKMYVSYPDMQNATVTDMEVLADMVKAGAA